MCFFFSTDPTDALRIHTNDVEGFWKIVKDAIKRTSGTSSALLESYIAEGVFRFNVRKAVILQVFYAEVRKMHRLV